MEFIKNTLKILLSDPEIIQAVILLLSGMMVWILKQAIQFFKLKISEARLQRLASAVDKVMTLGMAKFVTSTRDWTSTQTKNEIITFGLNEIKEKFKETLVSNNLDLANLEDRLRMVNMMDRMWLEVSSRAAASPAMPPAPTLAAGVVAPPTTA